jgi:hypothetical protein
MAAQFTQRSLAILRIHYVLLAYLGDIFYVISIC